MARPLSLIDGPDVFDDGLGAGNEALARRVIGLDCIQAEMQVWGLEARLATSKSDRTQTDRAVQEGDESAGSPTTASRFLTVAVR